MTMLSCWGKTILGRCSRRSFLGVIGAGAAAAAVVPPALAPLVRAYRQFPSPARLAAIKAFAAAHPKDAPLANLALGIAAYEQKDYNDAITRLKPLAAKLPTIADTIAYYVAASRLESGGTIAAKDLAPVRETAVPSPLAGKSWLLEARAVKIAAPADAVRILREHYAALPQPEGAVTLGDCYQASGDMKSAADFYQRVYYEYPTGDASARAAAAILTLHDTMGASYPSPMPAQILHRAERLQALRDFSGARAEYQNAIDAASGLEREQAQVRLAAVDLPAGNAASAASHLHALDLSQPEAQAERLYFELECARKPDDDAGILANLDELREKHAQSPWRMKALLAAGAHFYAENKPDRYVPIYQAASQDFPADPSAGLCRWRVAFTAYMTDGSDAEARLREQAREFPMHATAAAALYFLGRAAERRKAFGEARAWYDRIVTAYSNYYYASLAAVRLADPDVRAATPAEAVTQFLGGVQPPTPKQIPTEPTRPTTLRIERSRVLRSAGLPDLADSELRFGAATDSQPVLLGMEMASKSDSPHVAMRAMKALATDYLSVPLDRAPHQFWEYLFPLPYRDDLFAAARAQGVDPYLVAGLIRQESEFDPNALSRAGAYGLMQVRPATGRQFAAHAGVPRFTTHSLVAPAANLKIGAAIFRSMLDRNSGNVEQTLASYNAGPARAAEWLGWRTYREPAEFVETIPFNETRDYVQAVIRNAALYRRLYK